MRYRSIGGYVIAWLLMLFALPSSAAKSDILLSQSFFSDALGAQMKYSVYLPPDVDLTKDRKYATIYLLHGIGGHERDWPKLGKIEATLDHMIGEKHVAPLIVVMPAAGNSWYMDTASFGGPGDYESAILKDLRHHVEDSYPVSSDAADRAIVGLSMGGFGALRLGLSRATEFAAIGSYSPTLFWQYGEIARVTRREDVELAEEFGDHVPHNFFADHNPYAYLAEFLNAEVKPQIFLVAGDDDPLGTATYIVELQSVLTATGHDPEWRVYDGGHEWSVWRRAFQEHVALIGRTLWKPDAGSGEDPAQ